MFSIFKNNKRRNAELLLLSEAVATLRSQVSLFHDSVYNLKEKIEEVENEFENVVTLRIMRSELEEFMREESWDFVEYSVEQAIDDKLGDYYDSDAIDSQHDEMREEFFTEKQAKAELAKLSAMLFVAIHRSGLDFDEIEKESQPVYAKFMEGYEDNI